jgi:hypothetical protein
MRMTECHLFFYFYGTEDGLLFSFPFLSFAFLSFSSIDLSIPMVIMWSCGHYLSINCWPSIIHLQYSFIQSIDRPGATHAAEVTLQTVLAERYRS